MKNGPSENYDVVVIGAGLGGLLCANILSHEGFSVCVLEKNNRIGGSIQSFARNGVIFNTGLNFTESLGEGETLNRYFKYFGVFDKLNIRRMDMDAFEKISFTGDPVEYPFAQGKQNFVERLSACFPGERQNLTAYVELMEKACNSFPLFSLSESPDDSGKHQYLTTSAYDTLKGVTTNHKLQQVLAGTNSLYAGVEDSTPFYVHALICYSFMTSAWRLVDGSSQLAVQLARKIEDFGGHIFKNAEVDCLGGSNRTIGFARLKDGTRINGKHFISNLHPSLTVNLIEESLSKRGHRLRINSMQNTIGMFTLYVTFKEETFPYLNFNHHHFSEVNTWTTGYRISDWPTHFMMYTPAVSRSEKWADSAIVITYMRYEEVEQWADTAVGRRGESYHEFKNQKAGKLIDFVEKKLPGFKSSIKTFHTSTPLTYRDYTGTPEGSAYGILKNWKDPYAGLVSPRSRIPNLLYTGQNLNMHGILGVSIGSVLTCSELLGYEYLINKLKSF
ncbi:MAG: NAD(P)/FAD-dependent oxidoreductase [Bacteroidales bacterium]|nr:NAD(P)/FAD-dependent oxidoreductase [Bacteroidales bacterium]